MIKIIPHRHAQKSIPLLTIELVKMAIGIMNHNHLLLYAHCLNTRSPVGGTVWERLGGVTSLEKVGFEVLKAHTISN